MNYENNRMPKCITSEQSILRLTAPQSYQPKNCYNLSAWAEVCICSTQPQATGHWTCSNQPENVMIGATCNEQEC